MFFLYRALSVFNFFLFMNTFCPIVKNKIFLLPLVFVVIFLGSCNQPEPEPLKLDRIAYVSEGIVHVAGLNDGTHTEVGRGAEPSLSFDGRYLAYVNDVGNKRRIAVLDFPNRNTTIIEDVQGTSWGPVWSPTENRFLFSATAQSNGSSHRVVIVAHAREDKKYVIAREGINIYSPAWASDGETVYGHDTHFLYQWEKTVMLTSHAILTEKFGALDYNSSTKILPSADGNQWLIGIGAEEPSNRPRKNTFSVYLFDESRQQLQKVSPDNAFISDFTWSSDQQGVMFSGKEARNQRQNDLYLLLLADGSTRRIIKNAMQPSCRAIEVAQAQQK